jgi:hypothetical protein
MKIKTRYDVGYEFFVPRVYEKHEKETISHPDSYGIVRKYSRDICVLEATVRHKVVTHIEITVSSNKVVKITYWCKNKNEFDSMPGICKECDMQITNEEIAFAFAKKWRDEQQCPYFGSIEE